MSRVVVDDRGEIPVCYQHRRSFWNWREYYQHVKKEHPGLWARIQRLREAGIS